MSSRRSKRKKLEALAEDIRTEEDLADLSRQLLKLTVERALRAELDHHLGYQKHAPGGRNSGNSRNGYSPKTLKGALGEVDISAPRDRHSTFEPQLIRKGQTRLSQLDDQILTLYAQGMTTRDISATLEEMYSAEVSHSLISQVTETVLEEIEAWQVHPLDAVYPVVYLDCIVVQDKRVINKSIYLALGINLEGNKELLGLWMAENEGAKFWLSVLTELQNRGVKDIFIVCVDGLSGFAEAIQTVYPQTRVQLCIVHLMRQSLKCVSWKDRRAVAGELKRIYRSINVEEAERELGEFADRWDEKYPMISKIWRRHWEQIIPLFDYPDEIRKIIRVVGQRDSQGDPEPEDLSE
jgi:transposase-like protein